MFSYCFSPECVKMSIYGGVGKLNAVLHCSQHYLSYITATAYTIHVILGFHKDKGRALKCLTQGHSHERPLVDPVWLETSTV